MICAYQGDSQPPLPIWPGRKTPPVLANDSSAFSTDHDLEMLHHFIDVVGPNMYSKETLQANAIDIWSLARSVPHVMHAVLASAALHLNVTSPSRSNALIETGHWVQASSSFRTALANMSSSTNVDPILTTCMLLNLLSFANVGTHAPITSRWPLAPAVPGTDPLQWLSVQLGLTPLLTNLSAKTRDNSIWLPLFLASNYMHLYDERDGTVDIPDQWCELFSITDDSKIDEHVYLRLVRRVTLLRRIYDATEQEHSAFQRLGSKPNHDANTLKYMQFMQGVTASHVALLRKKDPLMMLLYVHWMALLCPTTHWWCWPRVRAECGAVVRFLDNVHGDWLGRNGWLDFPARAVGYELTCERPRDEDWCVEELPGLDSDGSWQDADLDKGQ